MLDKWIWVDDGIETENERCCFVREFEGNAACIDCRLRIYAVTRYYVFLNGQRIGYGPIRSGHQVRYYDEYSLGGVLRDGANRLCILVWNYGWSTYQTIGERGRLAFEILEDGRILAESDGQVQGHRDEGHIPYMPKRNVNLGFADYYDGRKFHADWITDSRVTEGWSNVRVYPSDVDDLVRRPILPWHTIDKYPQRVLKLQDVSQGCQVLTINTRTAFYGDRKDADETNFNAFLGCVIESPEDLSGKISFPNRTWNGLLGTFRIGASEYPVTDQEREVPVSIPKGKSLFLILLHGKYDDLYCHVEFQFEQRLKFVEFEGDASFFVIGPTSELSCVHDGRDPVDTDIDFITEEEQRIFSCTTLEDLLDTGESLRCIDPRYVMEDACLLSLNRLAGVEREYGIRQKHQGVLWCNGTDTCIDLPEVGDYRRLIVDFGDLCVGNISILLYAEAGTIIDFYGYENNFRGEIDFTIGLNNGMRYICRDGWQRFEGCSRMGMRYLILSVRNAKSQVRIRDLHIIEQTYASEQEGRFECSDHELNQIWRMCRRTLQLCQEDTFTDCPTYEQAFWLGDALISSCVNAYVCGDYEYIRHNLKLAVTAGKNSPLYNALTPTDWNTSIPLWTFNWMLAVFEYVEITSDQSILEELYGELYQVLSYYSTLLTEEGGFLSRAWNLVDWAKLDISDQCIVTAYQGILAYCFREMSRIAIQNRRKRDADFLTAVSEKMIRFLENRLWDPKREAFYDGWNEKTGYSKTKSIQTHMLLLRAGVVRNPVQTEKICSYVRTCPDDFVRVGSPFMLFFLYQEQLKLGEAEKVFEDIRKRWGEMIRYESTTCWEVFPGFYENSRTRSYCHAWSTAPAMLLEDYYLGIRREKQGYQEISFVLPDTEIRWCRGSIPTPHGRIDVEWDKEDRECLIELPEAIQIHRLTADGMKIRVLRREM